MSAPEGDLGGAKVGGAVAFVFVLGIAFLATLVLAIVGAPVGVVQAVAPLAALFATLAYSLPLAAPSLLGFAAVGRQAGVFAAGLAFALAVGGVVLAQTGADAPASATCLVAGGACLAALVAARARFGGTLSDILATRIAFWPLRAPFALAFLAIGALTAMAGLALAQGALDEALAVPAKVTDVLLGAALALSVASGGARSLVWLDAASAAFIGLVLAGAMGLAAARGPAPAFDLTAAAAALRGSVFDTPWTAFAQLAAMATFAPSALALGASGSLARGLKIGGLGVVVGAGALAVLAAVSPWLTRSGAAIDPARQALMILVGLALARQGLLVAVRAFGLNLRLDPQRIANTASARLAQLRVASVLLSVALVFGAHASGASASTTMTAALALSLALTAPSMVLTLTPRAGAVACALALLVGLASFFRQGRLPHDLAEITLSSAAQGAVVALVVGALVAWLFPVRSAEPPVRDGMFE